MGINLFRCKKKPHEPNAHIEYRYHHQRLHLQLETFNQICAITVEWITYNFARTSTDKSTLCVLAVRISKLKMEWNYNYKIHTVRLVRDGVEWSGRRSQYARTHNQMMAQIYVFKLLYVIEGCQITKRLMHMNVRCSTKTENETF